MSLVKCVDCGNLVSERASACMKCGCPIRFMLNVQERCPECDSIVEANNEVCLNCGFPLHGNSSKSNDIAIQKKEQKLVQVKRKDVGLWYHGYLLKFNSDAISQNYVRGLFAKLANEQAKKFSSEYRINVHSYTQMKTIGIQLAQKNVNEGLEWAANFAVEHLFVPDISAEVLKASDARYFDLEQYIEPLLYQFDLLDESIQKAEQKSAVRKSRGMYWNGGGFGLAGAIKGVAMAGMLNLGTGALRAIKNGTLDGLDRVKINRMKEEIFQNQYYVNMLVEGVRQAVYNIINPLIIELKKRGSVSYGLVGDEKQSEQILSHIKTQYENNTINIKKADEQMVELIEENPFNLEAYLTMMYVHDFCLDKDIENIVDYFNMEFVYYRQAAFRCIQYLQNINLEKSDVAKNKQQIKNIKNIRFFNSSTVKNPTLELYLKAAESVSESKEKEINIREKHEGLVDQILQREREIKIPTDKLYAQKGVEALWDEVAKGNGYAEYLIVEHYAKIGKKMHEEYDNLEKQNFDNLQKGKDRVKLPNMTEKLNEVLHSVLEKEKAGNRFARYVNLRTRGYAGDRSHQCADTLALELAGTTNFAIGKTEQGICCYRGKYNVKKDVDKAIRVLTESALRYEPRAIGMLGQIYRYENRLPYHEQIAKQLYQIAAKYNIAFVEEELRKRR